MDFFQRLGNWFGGKGWINDEEKRRKEQQQAAPQPQPAPQPVRPQSVQQGGRWQAAGRGQQPSAALQERRRVLDGNAVYRQNLMNQARNEINTAINDPTGYYKQDADQLREEIGKGKAANENRIQGLLQSVQNRRKEISEGRAPTQRILESHAQQKTQDTQADEQFRQNLTAKAMANRGNRTDQQIHEAVDRAVQANRQARAAQRTAEASKRAADFVGVVTAPGRAVASVTKGAAKSVASFVPNTVNSTAEFAGNTIKAFDENNQFADGLVRKAQTNRQETERQLSFLNKADYDIGVAHAFGEGAGNLAIDTALTIASGGTSKAAQVANLAGKSGAAGIVKRMLLNPANAAAARHYVENVNDVTRDAKSHGLSHRDAFLRGNASAGAQAALERVALNKLVNPNAKSAVGRFMKSAITEGSEEAAQQLADNAVRMTYDPKKKLTDNVLEAAIMGGALGGPTGAVMGSRSAISTQDSVSPVSAQTAAEVQNNYRQGKLSSPEAVESTIPQASPALKQAVSKDVAAIEHGNTGLLNYRRKTSGRLENFLVQEATEYHIAQNMDTRYKLNPEQAAEIRAYNDHIGLLRQQESKLLAQGLSENSAPVINNRKAQAEAIYARDHIGEMSPEGVKYKQSITDEQRAAINERLSNAYVVKGESLTDTTKAYIDDLKEHIESDRQNIQRYEAEGKPGAAQMYREMMERKIGMLNEELAAAQDQTKSVYRGENIDLSHYRGFNEYPRSDADWNLDDDIEAASRSLASELNSALDSAGLGDRISVTHSRSGSSEANYIQIYDEELDARLEIRIANHYKSGASGNGDVNITLSDPDITDFGVVADRVYDSFKRFILTDNEVRSSFKQTKAALRSAHDLMARHLQITGDKKLVFNEWRNAMEQSALGYYDPKTDKINLNQLTEDTLNHELGHKLLRRAENNAELIAHIRQTVGDDALVARYGKDYGTDDMNLLAEEYLADGFSDYSKGILNGEDKVRLATRLNIPQEIVAVYDRIIEAVKSLIGKQDQIRQFYAQIETGKFRSAPQATTTLRRLEGSLAYRLDSQQAKDTIARFNSVKNGWRRKTIMSRVTPEVAEMYRKETGMPVGDNARLILSESAVRHMKNQGHIGGKGRYGAEDTNPITDADIADIPVVFANPDSIQVKNEVGYKGRKIELTKQLDNRHVLAVELEQKPDGDFYIISYYNKSRSPRQAQASGSQGLDADFNEVPTSSRPKRPGEASDDSIANPPRIVNDKRFKINDTAQLSEAGQDARDFYFEEYKDKGADAMRQDLIDQIWNENKKGQGVDFIQTPGEYYGGKRVSNNNPFYAGFYEEYGRKPTKQEITAIVDDALGIENELGRVSLPRAAEDYLIGNYFGDIDGLRAAYSQVGTQANTQVARPTANKLDNAARQEASEALQQEYETHLDHQWAARLDEKHKQEILKQRKAFDRQQQIKELIKHAYEQGPSRKLVDIADAVKSVTKAKKGEVEAIMQQVADDMNLDITGERAFVKNTSKVPSLVDPTTGEVTPIDQLISDEAVRKQMKPGVEHAVPADTERADLQGNARQMIYRNEDGTYGAYYEYRKADGTWHKPGAVPVTSALQTNLMSKITDDATINKEVKRAYEDGINIQYIWRESSDGANSELVKKFEEIVDKALTVVGKGKKKSPPGEVLSFDPNIHYIHKGKVVDGRTGQVMGNYVEITAKGDVIMYAGKKKIHLRQNDLDFDAFKKLWSSGATWTTEGQIDRMTGALDWPWSRSKDRSNSIEYFMEGKKNANKETLTEIMVELPRRMQAAMLQEGEALGSMVDEHAKKLRRTLPLRGRKQALQEAVYVIEPARPKRGEKAPTFEQRLESFRQVYGDRAAKQLAEYNAFLRATYKNLLMRVNEKRLELGMEPIHERADYLTHTSEIHSAGQTIFDNISSLAAGDIMDKGRGGLPAKLVGLTGSFKPNMKFNQFAQARYGDTKPADPFTPLKEYAKVALHNIHMTDAITMNRSLETAFRAASEARSEVAQMGPIGVETLANKVDDFAQNIRGNEIDIDEATTVLKKIYGLERGLRTKINGFTEFKRSVNKARRASEGKETAVLADEDLAVLKNATERMVSSLVETSEDIVKFQELTKTADSLGKATYFVREHANRLAGKTDAMERAAKDEAGVLDRAGNMAIRGMQKQAALSKIVGNFSSVVAQAFSLPDLAATTSPTALGKALKSMWDPKVQQASAAVASRYANDTLSRRSTFDKTMGIAGKPMEVFERTIIQYSFAAKYEHGISKGLSHDDAVRYAERFIGDTVTYRDAVSTPRAYKRKLPSLLLQFQREVVQQGRYKLRYITPRRAAVALALYAVMAQAFEAVTGNKPGGDVVGALVATALDFAGAGDEGREEGEKTAGARIGRGIGRMTGEVVAMAPLVGSPINTFIDKETRKNIFGTENNLGRYAGGLAAVSQIQSAGKAISYWHKADKAAAEGDDDKATALRERSILSAIKEVPAGSQLRKSAQGYFAMSRGHTLNSDGEIKAEVDKNNPLKWVQAVAFGENALSEQQRANKTDNWFLRGGDSSASAAVGGVRPGLDLLDKKERLKIQKKLKSGEWREENGLMVDKQGDVQRTYHRALAQTQGESDEAYANWMKAYDIDNAGSKPRRSSGNAMLDRLQAEKDKTNSAETAIKLVTDTEKYRDLPQWVKDRYYEKSGYKKHEIEYAALASYGPSEKLHAYWLPRAKELSHEQLLQELTNGRRESIAGDILAPNGVVDNLALRGLISKDEARALRRTNFTHDGTPKASGRDGNGSGGGRGRGSSLAAIHEAFSRSVQLSKNARAHRPATTTSATGRVAMKQAQLRKWSPSRRATSTIRSRRST